MILETPRKNYFLAFRKATLRLTPGCAILFFISAAHADQIKVNNNTNLELGGNVVSITNNDAVKTFRVTTDNGNYNANFYLLAPVYTPPSSVSLSANNSGNSLNLSFPTQPGYDYQVEYKTNLTDVLWLPLGGLISGNGSTQTVNDSGSASRFYRVRIQ